MRILMQSQVGVSKAFGVVVGQVLAVQRCQQDLEIRFYIFSVSLLSKKGGEGAYSPGVLRARRQGVTF